MPAVQDAGAGARQDALAGALARVVRERQERATAVPAVAERAAPLQRRTHKHAAGSAPATDAGETDAGTDAGGSESKKVKNAFLLEASSRRKDHGKAANLAEGEGGKELAPTAMQALLRGQLARGGLVVAMYVGDESGGEIVRKDKHKKPITAYNDGAGGEFRKQAYKFAIAHGAVGVGKGGLRANMAMEMTATTPRQIASIVAAAEEALAGVPHPPVQVGTLAIMTHGWEAGIRVDVNEKEFAEHEFSNKVVAGLYSDDQYSWIAQVAQYLAKDVSVVLYACRAAGDVDSAHNMGLWAEAHAIKDPAKRRKRLQELESKAVNHGNFQEFRGWAPSEAWMGGGMPLAARVYDGIEQSHVRRLMAKGRPDVLKDLERGWLDAVATAKRTVDGEAKRLKHTPGYHELTSPERDSAITATAKTIFAKANRGYEQALLAVRRDSTIRVLSHLDRGNTVGNSRLAEFAGEWLDPEHPERKTLTRTSFPHALAEGIIFAVLERDPARARGPGYTMDEIQALIGVLGMWIIATKEEWRQPDAKKSSLMVRLIGDTSLRPEPSASEAAEQQAAIAALDARVAAQRKSTTDKTQRRGIDKGYKQAKKAITGAWSTDEIVHAKEMTIREIPFLGIHNAVAILTSTRKPTLQDVAHVPITDDARLSMVLGLTIFHRYVQATIAKMVSNRNVIANKGAG